MTLVWTPALGGHSQVMLTRVGCQARPNLVLEMGGERTVIRGGTTANFITSYFRRTFQVVNVADIPRLVLGLLRDDGAVVYINGLEVLRSNMPDGTISHQTLAKSPAVGDASEWLFHRLSIPTSTLVEGENTIAVEVHQNTASSSDLSFDLFLKAIDHEEVTRGPYLQRGSSDAVVVRWRTMLPTDSRVRYGTSAGSLTSIAESALVTTEHELELSGLRPGTVYYYSIGTTSQVLLESPEFNFRTFPQAGQSQPTRVWVLGDNGTADISASAVRDSYLRYNAGRRTDAWLLLGDNAYNTGLDDEYQAAMFDLYPTLLQSSFLYTTIGNHETAQNRNPVGSFPYLDMFTLPTRGESGGLASGTERYYSFDCGDIHFLCLDSMTSSLRSDSTMMEWAKQDLAATQQKWVIAFWHHPPYTKGSHNSDATTGVDVELSTLRANLLPILESSGVDLVLSGHSHSYERSYLLTGHYGVSSTLTEEMKLDGGSGRMHDTGPYRKTLGISSRQGTVYTVAGSSGRNDGGLLNHPAMYVSRSALGSVVLDVAGNRLDASFLSVNGELLDTYTLLKDAPEETPPIVVRSPKKVAVAEGGLAVIAPVVEGATPLSYQWSKDGFVIQGATGRVLSLPIASTTHEGSYRLQVSNAFGSVVSEPVNLEIALPLNPGTGTGLLGEYYDDIFFSVFKLARLDPVVDFRYGSGSPAPSIGPDTFSVRWTGYVEARYTGPHTFLAGADDGMRLWIDGRLVSDNFSLHAYGENKAVVPLIAGYRHSIRIDYFENFVIADATLRWSELGGPVKTIPQSQLYPANVATPRTRGLIDFSQTWKYQTNRLDDSTWAARDYNDAEWLGQGPGLFYFDPSAPGSAGVAPKGTLLPSMDGDQGSASKVATTYYFRTRFDYAGPTRPSSLVFSNYIDDGAIFYLNGTEIQRVRMPGTPVTWSTFATGANPDESCGGDAIASCPTVFTLTGEALTPLTFGENVLAVEVHNQSGDSPDVVFGCDVRAILPRDSSVPPTLNIQTVDDWMKFEWSGEEFILQRTSRLAGQETEWSDVAVGIRQSPIFLPREPSTGFFRLREP